MSLTDGFPEGNCFRCGINKRYSTIEVGHEFRFEAGVLLNRTEEVISGVRNAQQFLSEALLLGTSAIHQKLNGMSLVLLFLTHNSDTRRAIYDQRE